MAIASKVMSRVPARMLVPYIAWQYQLYEPELGRIEEFVPAHRGAVDAGVWWGPWTWRLATWAPRVEAFEPNASLVNRLASVMPSNVNLHCVALSDHEGESELWVPNSGAGTEGRASLEAAVHASSRSTPQLVATRRLDDFELGDIGFIKIDVEGHELAVLEGATKLLEAQRPTVLVEIEENAHRADSLDRIVKLFADISYEGRYLQGGEWNPIENLDRAAVKKKANRVAQNRYWTNLLFYSRSYIHNFLFSPS